ncbi:MAG: hypothetical protein ACE5J4_00405 [Candidatus Aenigmatarchaeota archaeon]
MKEDYNILKTIAKGTIEVDRIDIEIRKLTGFLIRKLTIFSVDKGFDEKISELSSLLLRLEELKERLVRNIENIDKVREDIVDKLKEKHQVQFVELDVRSTKCIGKIDNLLNVIEDSLEVFKETKNITKEQKDEITKIEKKLKDIKEKWFK